MRPEAHNDVDERELALLDAVRREVQRMRNGLTCHEVCAALAQQFPRMVVHARGTFNCFDHSWLVTRNGNIIDPYPWACASGPLLLVGWAPMWSSLYREKIHEGGVPAADSG